MTFRRVWFLDGHFASSPCPVDRPDAGGDSVAHSRCLPSAIGKHLQTRKCEISLVGQITHRYGRLLRSMDERAASHVSLPCAPHARWDCANCSLPYGSGMEVEWCRRAMAFLCRRHVGASMSADSRRLSVRLQSIYIIAVVRPQSKSRGLAEPWIDDDAAATSSQQQLMQHCLSKIQSTLKKHRRVAYLLVSAAISS